MDWSLIGELGKYAPFLFAEMSKHPTIAPWVQKAMQSEPKEEFGKIQADLQTNIRSGAIQIPAGATPIEQFAAYLPFVFAEMAKRPTVSAWAQQVLASMPTSELIAVIGDAQQQAKQLST